MKKFGAKRVARKIGGDDEDVAKEQQSQTVEPTVKRPVLSKSKKPSSGRLSFGPSKQTTEDEGVSTPKTGGLGRIALEKSAARLSSEQLPIRAGAETERPSYSKDYLAELRNAQRSAPPKEDLDSTVAITNQTRELDIASKFGSQVTNTSIPTAAEIAEKKERRARLAKEQVAGQDDFISLDDTGGDFHASTYSDDDEFRPRNTLVLPEKDKYAETRLVRDDEDVAEGFDDFVSDGKLALGRAAARDEQRRQRAEMREMIDAAEGNDDESVVSDDSEAERNAAYEAAQTKRSGVRNTDKDDGRPRTPPKIGAVPELSAVIKKLKAAVEEAERVKMAKVRRLAEVKKERADINEREVWVQQQLKEAGERFEKLKQEASLPPAIAAPKNDTVMEEDAAKDDDMDGQDDGAASSMRSALLGNNIAAPGGMGSTMRPPSPEW